MAWVSVENSRLELGLGNGATFEIHNAILRGSQIVLDDFSFLVQRNPILLILVGDVHITHGNIGLLFLPVGDENQNAIAFQVLIRIFLRGI